MIKWHEVVVADVVQMPAALQALEQHMAEHQCVDLFHFRHQTEYDLRTGKVLHTLDALYEAVR